MSLRISAAGRDWWVAFDVDRATLRSGKLTIEISREEWDQFSKLKFEDEPDVNMVWAVGSVHPFEQFLKGKIASHARLAMGRDWLELVPLDRAGA